jgi:hypothetical protein
MLDMPISFDIFMSFDMLGSLAIAISPNSTAPDKGAVAFYLFLAEFQLGTLEVARLFKTV